MKNNNNIVLRDICKSFHKTPILNHVNLHIAQGQSAVLLGASGVGKSVLFRCILGLDAYDKGEIFLGASRIGFETGTQQQKRFQSIGVVFQHSALFDGMNVWDNIGFSLYNRPRISNPYQKIQKALDTVGLSIAQSTLFPNELSGGMRRRVSIARAIVHEPCLLFFDEPTAGLDPVASHTISHLIRQMILSLNATCLTITHDVTNAKIVADEAFFMADGDIIWKGHARELSFTNCAAVRHFVSGGQGYVL
jgi:phospholipid/cholesterol/gamma-HCH transport system ATP-binding protein